MNFIIIHLLTIPHIYLYLREIDFRGGKKLGKTPGPLHQAIKELTHRDKQPLLH